MDDLTADSNPDIAILWQDSSLSLANWTVAGIAMNYSTSAGGYDYIYWAVTDNEYVGYYNSNSKYRFLFTYLHHRNTRLYKKQLGGPEDGGVEYEIRQYSGILHVEAFRGSVYLRQRSPFLDSIINFENHAAPTNALAFGTSNPPLFNDFVIMHHSLQPGR